MPHHIQLLWFSDCPNHEAVRALLREMRERLASDSTLEDIDASDPAVAAHYRSPGSPTVRVDEIDVDPAFEDPRDYTPRCRLYRTSHGLGGRPDPAWIEQALKREPPQD